MLDEATLAIMYASFMAVHLNQYREIDLDNIAWINECFNKWMLDFLITDVESFDDIKVSMKAHINDCFI